MRTIGCLWADLETNGFGLPSRLLDPLAGEILLLRVLRRAVQCPALERVVVLCPPKDEGRLKGLALPERCELMATQAADVPQRAWLRKARKWSVDGWRGGIGWTSAFDEEGPPTAFWDACQRFQADAVVKLPSHAPFLDARLLGDLVDLHLRRRGSYQFSFAQAPPGLLGEAYHPEFLKTMADHAMTPRHALMWSPQREGMDPQRAECHLDVGERIRNSPWRLSVESPRLWRQAERLLAAGGELPPPGGPSWDLPREVLCDPGALSPETWAEWIAALGKEGDASVTFGVNADPLAFPDWQGLVSATRRAGIYGIHLRTPKNLDEGEAEALLDAELDVLSVVWSPAAEEGLERLKLAQQKRGPSAPLIALEFRISPENEGELPGVWERWGARVDWAFVRGAEKPALSLAPPDRRPCRKLEHLLYVAPAGTVFPCAQEGSRPLGRVGEDGMDRIWKGKALASLREAHRAGSYPDASPECLTCREWGWV